ncbi:MAG: sulfatase-like hydrolase/transferase [Planctomycetes bacterium]|nr:sulfatase-like hydrolase/transferase [Planctomycetota bacterium]
MIGQTLTRPLRPTAPNPVNISKVSIAMMHHTSQKHAPKFYILALAACLLALCGPAVRAADHPNVLFIAIDDLNDWVGCLGGHPQARTPNIDKLASRGLLFTNAYTAAPLCNPSRAATMTGVRPSTSGIYGNMQPMRKSPVLEHIQTLPQHLRQSGYTAVGAGKIYHVAFPDPPSWDAYFPSQNKTKPDDPKPPHPSMNGLKHGLFDWAPLDVPDKDMGDYQVADWVIDQIGKPHDKPLFLACGFYKPHLPWFVPASYFDHHPVNTVQRPPYLANDLDDVPPIGKKIALLQGDQKIIVEHNAWNAGVQAYLAATEFSDAQVGRVLDAFDKLPPNEQKNWIIVLWTDHGWHLGEKDHWRKLTLWDEATRVPLIIIAPGLTRPGSTCARTVSLLDLYPTLCDLTGTPLRKDLDGVSLRPLLADPAAAWDRPAVTTHSRNNHAVRDERYRYIRYEDGTEELYDHTTDPNEWKNLAADPALTPIKQKLAAYLPKINAAPTPTRRNANPDGESE